MYAFICNKKTTEAQDMNGLFISSVDDFIHRHSNQGPRT